MKFATVKRKTSDELKSLSEKLVSDQNQRSSEHSPVWAERLVDRKK